MTTNIEHYEPMGFKRICRVQLDDDNESWYYSNIDMDLMFSPHRSWLYLITVNGQVWKIGETGNPLGLHPARITGEHPEIQPITGTQSRLGRYRKGDGTDSRCRAELRANITQGDLVEFWARECPKTPVDIELNDYVISIHSHHHKDLEMALIDYFVKFNGRLPPGNLSRK